MESVIGTKFDVIGDRNTLIQCPNIAVETALSGEIDQLVDYYSEVLLEDRVRVGGGFEGLGLGDK